MIDRRCPSSPGCHSRGDWWVDVAKKAFPFPPRPFPPRFLTGLPFPPLGRRAFLAGMVACYKGLYAKGGPKGVGDAVNQAVVITFVLLFFVNFVLTVIYFNFVPQKV